jgi:hypothetical protein
VLGSKRKTKVEEPLNQTQCECPRNSQTRSCFPVLSSESSNGSMTFENENDNNDIENIENQSLLPLNESITDELQTCESCHRTYISM